MLHQFIDTIFAFFSDMGYLDIFVLMAMESSIIPVPSELVMLPAGILASQGQLDPIFAILVGGVGSVVWALANYWILGYWLGRPFLEKYGKYILITKEKYKKTEDLFLKNDVLYTFLGRLIPVVRHLISIPAGIFRMKMRSFILITFAWATLWCAVLVIFGYVFGESIIDIVVEYMHIIKYMVIPILALFFWWKIFKK